MRYCGSIDLNFGLVQFHTERLIREHRNRNCKSIYEEESVIHSIYKGILIISFNSSLINWIRERVEGQNRYFEKKILLALKIRIDALNIALPKNNVEVQLKNCHQKRGCVITYLVTEYRITPHFDS